MNEKTIGGTRVLAVAIPRWLFGFLNRSPATCGDIKKTNDQFSQTERIKRQSLSYYFPKTSFVRTDTTKVLAAQSLNVT